MKFKTLILATFLTLPTLCSAVDITVTNNTQQIGTGSIYGTCSNKIGDKGVIKPGQTLTLTENALELLCFGMSCTAKIYISPNCTGKVVATAKLHPRKGILSIDNRDSANFIVNYNQTTAIVEDSHG